MGMPVMILLPLLCLAVLAFALAVFTNVSALVGLPHPLDAAVMPVLPLGAVALWLLILAAGHLLQRGLSRTQLELLKTASAPAWMSRVASLFGVYAAALIALAAGGGSIGDLPVGWGSTAEYGSSRWAQGWSGLSLLFTWLAIAALVSLLSGYRLLDGRLEPEAEPSQDSGEPKVAPPG